MIWQKTTANTPNLAELENMKLPKPTPENLPTVRPYLPDTFLQLETVAGTQTALLLVSEHGGVQYPVAKGVTGQGRRRNTRLAALVGEAAALRLSAAYGQQRNISIPTCRKAREVLRNREIRAAYDMAEGSGMAAAALARRYGLSQRAIFAILKRSE